MRADVAAIVGPTYRLGTVHPVGVLILRSGVVADLQVIHSSVYIQYCEHLAGPDALSKLLHEAGVRGQIWLGACFNVAAAPLSPRLLCTYLERLCLHVRTPMYRRGGGTSSLDLLWIRL